MPKDEIISNKLFISKNYNEIKKESFLSKEPKSVSIFVCSNILKIAISKILSNIVEQHLTQVYIPHLIILFIFLYLSIN